MQAGDVVLKLTLRTGEEGEAFALFLDRFLTAACETVDRMARSLQAGLEPPFVMVCSEPCGETDLRIVTFREAALANAFALGWDRARGGSRAVLTA